MQSLLSSKSLRTSESPQGVVESALQIAELPLKVHPLIEKRPILKEWPSRASADQRQIQQWLKTGDRNYGIVCDEIAVIDTDTRELAVWWFQNMPETPWMVKTPSGGVHFVYRSVPGLRNAVKAHRGWDVRAGGNGSIVGFGSEIGGRRYELIGEATLDLPLFDPAWLPRPEPTEMPRLVVPTEGSIRNLQAYIRRIMSIQGQNGSGACFRAACVLRDEGLTQEQALAHMIEWNECCAVPPWSVDQLRKKIRDAFAAALQGERNAM